VAYSTSNGKRYRGGKRCVAGGPNLVTPIINKLMEYQCICFLTKKPFLSYCAPVWDGLGVTLSDRLRKLQNRAARVITRSTYDISSSQLLDQLQWNTLSVNRHKQKAVVMFKTLINGQSPQYLQELFSSRNSQYSLRNSKGKLFIPKPNTDYLKRSILQL
jgi:hypothetical protein